MYRYEAQENVYKNIEILVLFRNWNVYWKNVVNKITMHFCLKLKKQIYFLTKRK